MTILADRIVARPVAELIPYANNSRTHSERQIEQVAASIREFGFTNPVLCDSAGNITAGHARVLAAARLGLEEVPTIDIGYLNEAQRRAYLIADNKLALNAGWDEAVLAAELTDLRLEGIDLELLTGFEVGEIDKLIAGEQPPDEFSEYDENIETTHHCPKCGFSWSGSSTSSREAAD